MTRAGGRVARSLHCAKRIGRLAAALWLVAGVALAAPKDKTANKAIDRAINEQYVTTDFKGAQKALIDVVSKCGSDCSPKVVARAWMYVGLVRAMGLQDKQGAEEAFGLAVAVDPKVVLDEGLASPEVKKRFLSIKANAGSVADADADAVDADADAGDEDDSDEAAPSGGDGEVFCAPLPSEVEAGRRIPVQCAAPEGATVELLYKAPGSTKWTKAKMDEVSAEKGTFRGEVPCKRTEKRGGIKWYVRARANGDEVGSVGSKSKPNRIKLVGETSEEPPSYPGSKAPARCDGEEDDDSGAADSEEDADPDEDADADEDEDEAPEAAPVAAPKVKGAWGATCEADDQCEEGLLCLNGGCESPNKCETDDDCEDEGAYCSGDGVCEHGEVGHFPLRLNWVGASVSMDLLAVGGSEVCRPNDPGDPEDPDDDIMGSPAGLVFQCLTRQVVLDDEGDPTDDFALQPYGPPNLPADVTDRGGRVAGGIAPGTLRIMLNYERLLNNGAWTTFGVQARAGLILLDSLPSTRTFIPLHLELRGKYYFGDKPFEHSRFRPFFSIGGGLGSSSTSLRVDVDDCTFARKDTRAGADGMRLLNEAGGVSRDDGDAFYPQDVAAAAVQPSDLPSDDEYESATATELCLAYPGESGANPQRSRRASGEDPARGPLAVFRAGPAFASAGLGAMIAVGERHGFELSVEAALLLPTFAFVLRPTLGYVVGF